MKTEEGVSSVIEAVKEPSVQRRGRPVGSKNKPKSVAGSAPTEAGDTLPAPNVVVVVEAKPSVKPKVDLPKTGPSAADIAEKVLIAKQKQLLEQKIEQVAKKIQDEVWALSCRANQKHFGIFFTENPKGKDIHPGMWYSTYHEPSSPWTFGTGHIVCQECRALTGADVALPINETTKQRMRGTTFRIPRSYERFLRAIPAKQFKEYLEGKEEEKSNG